jgi:hypothetical protein
MKKTSYFLAIAVCLLAFASSAGATTPTTLTLNNTTGDVVQVTISGAINSSVQLSFLPPGATSMTVITFGTTDGSGNFSTSISSGGYGIPAGSPVYVTIDGVQSPMALWPSYVSVLTLSQASASVAVGASITINASNSVTLASNSAPTKIAASISGSQIIISGSASGSGSLIFCAANAGCKTLTVEVGGLGSGSQVAFSQNNFTLTAGQSRNIIISGSTGGYRIISNSNTVAIDASIAGTSSVISLYAKAAGSVTISVCSIESNTNCADLKVTVLDNSVSALTFSQNNIILTSGLTQTVSVSGGSSGSYYILSNSNTGVAVVTISGNVVTVIGGTNIASSVVTVCSTSVNNICGNLNITLASSSSSTSSATVLAFSQNVVSVARGDTSNVTVSGGDGTGYSISSNSNPSVVTGSISSGSNNIALYGNAEGSAIVTVCSASTNTICASMYVTVGPALPTIYLSRDSVSIVSEGSFIVNIIGGNNNNVIYSNSNPNAVAARLTNNSNTIILNNGTVSGFSSIIICPTSDYSNKCATLSVTNGSSSAGQSSSSSSSSSGQLIKASSASVYYLATNGKRYVFPNEKTFKTWYSDFSTVKTISDSELAAITIGGNVTYRPGAKMVKITTDPKVYVIDSHATLRWITSEAVAIALYGTNWNKMIEDIPDAFFSNYTIGANINTASEFNPSSISANASSINVDKGL